MHNDFTLFVRTYPNGKKVVFYHAYDENGKRVGPWTTHSRNLTAARARCNKLLKAGALIPGKNKAVTFAKFAEGFWDRNSEYARRQESRADITESCLKKRCQSLFLAPISLLAAFLAFGCPQEPSPTQETDVVDPNNPGGGKGLCFLADGKYATRLQKNSD